MKLGKIKYALLPTLLAAYYAHPARALIGGERAEINQFPGQISLRRATGRHFCGATKIAPRLMITAAHCLHPEEGAIELKSELKPEFKKGGKFSIAEGPDLTAPLRVVSLHTDLIWEAPKEAGLKAAPDLALIQTREEITGVSEAVVMTTPLRVGAEVVVTGMGCQTQEGGDSGQELDFGKARVSGFQFSSFRFPSDPVQGTSIALCPGDSGGGTYVENSGRFELVGVNSAITGMQDAAFSIVSRLDASGGAGFLSFVIGMLGSK